jgi:hypothetical protein
VITGSCKQQGFFDSADRQLLVCGYHRYVQTAAPRQNIAIFKHGTSWQKKSYLSTIVE